VKGDDFPTSSRRRTDLSRLTIGTDARIQDGITAIDAGRAQIALVVDDQGRLVGTLTDGDIRRGLLRNMTLEDSVAKVMQCDFGSVDRGTSDHEALGIMRLSRYHQMPVLDDDGRVTALIVLEDLLYPPRLDNPVLLMAGGKGERLRPLTSDLPKPMLPLGGTPVLEIILEKCIASGLHQFLISVGYLKERIIEYFGDGSKWGVEISYLEEHKPLGTGGALGLINDSLSSPLLVINGDVVTSVNFSELLNFHIRQNATATICIRSHEIHIPFGVVATDGYLLQHFEEKPVVRRNVNAGIYVLNPSVVNGVPRHTYVDMPGLLQREAASEDVYVFPIHEYWSDIGNLDALQQAQSEWL
jgi:GTP:adenosylcobinamide-phosphate guanylyltransferase